jgi:hypothetical protein
MVVFLLQPVKVERRSRRYILSGAQARVILPWNLKAGSFGHSGTWLKIKNPDYSQRKDGESYLTAGEEEIGFGLDILTTVFSQLCAERSGGAWGVAGPVPWRVAPDLTPWRSPTPARWSWAVGGALRAGHT